MTANFWETTIHILLTYKNKLLCLFTPEDIWLKPKDYNSLRNGPCNHKFKVWDVCQSILRPLIKLYINTIVQYPCCNFIMAEENFLA